MRPEATAWRISISCGKMPGCRSCWAMRCRARKQRGNSSISFMTEKRSSKRSRRWPRTGELHSEREPGFTRSGAGEPRRGWELGRRCPAQKIATLDVDATIIESWKREAKSLLRRRGELVERSFAHCYETGAMRRC